MPDNAAMKTLTAAIDSMAPEFTAISDRIWEFAELKFDEVQSSGLLVETLKHNGFAVRQGIADMATAFIGEYGSGKPVIAFLGEYDALAGMSQKDGVDRIEEVVAAGTGHGCGHNLLGSGSMLAAVALARHLKANGLPGTVRYYGCPGEEGGSGKTFMVRAGEFADVDAALTWHPAPFNVVVSNVAGPREEIMLGDSRLVDLFSVGPILEGIGLNVTVWSYQDRVNITVISCPDLVPDLYPLVAEFGPALQDLLTSSAAPTSPKNNGE